MNKLDLEVLQRAKKQMMITVEEGGKGCEDMPNVVKYVEGVFDEMFEILEKHQKGG